MSKTETYFRRLRYPSDSQAKVNCQHARSPYAGTESFSASGLASIENDDHHKAETTRRRPLIGSCNDGASVDAGGEGGRLGLIGDSGFAPKWVQSVRKATVFDRSGQRGHGSRVPSFAQLVGGRRCAAKRVRPSVRDCSHDLGASTNVPDTALDADKPFRASTYLHDRAKLQPS